MIKYGINYTTVNILVVQACNGVIDKIGLITMTAKCKKRNTLSVITASVLLACCLWLFCGCHVFAWYIPKPYSDEKKAEIYAFIKNDLLSDVSDYIVGVSYNLPEQEGGSVSYNIFGSEGKVIISYDKYSKKGSPLIYGVWYNGERKEWDVKTKTETVTEVSVNEYAFLFDYVERYAEFLKTKIVDVASYRDDSYFWECFPWGMGMAQMYYDDVDGMSVTGFWTVERKSAVKHDGLPLVFSAEFDCGNDNGGIRAEFYGSPYGIDERITNILKNYEENKKRPDYIEDVNVYLTVNGNKMSLLLYDNPAVRALIAELEKGDVTLTVDDYDGFEKVGNLGMSLPESDERITACVGDVILYQGDKIAVFYGENTWSYTRIGQIVGYSDDLITEMLGAGNGETQLTLSLN